MLPSIRFSHRKPVHLMTGPLKIASSKVQKLDVEQIAAEISNELILDDCAVHTIRCGYRVSAERWEVLVLYQEPDNVNRQAHIKGYLKMCVLKGAPTQDVVLYGQGDVLCENLAQYWGENDMEVYSEFEFKSKSMSHGLSCLNEKARLQVQVGSQSHPEWKHIYKFCKSS
ncbi:hypothetical protein BDV06DRAFT_218926 [Aspergillus oleicola]